MSTNKQFKGKPITTSVPTFAIRFHTSGEELEELYPSEEDDKSLTEEKCSEASVSSEPTKQESSPMRDYLNKFGKRSSSIDAGINDTSQPTSNDPWRIFSEFKGKLTKTVEEKLSEIKSKNSDTENSPKFTKANSKDNSSISDSEEQSYSECSVPKSGTLSSTAEDIELSSDDEGSLVENDKTPTGTKMVITAPSELRNRKNPEFNISYSKDQEEIVLQTINPVITEEKKNEEEIESGIEAYEVFQDYTLMTDVSHTSPLGFVDMRLKQMPVIKPTRNKYYFTILMITLILSLYIFPKFTLGCFTGFFASVCCYFYYNYIHNAKESKDVVIEENVTILEIPAVKEYQPITRFEGWINEYPEVYNPYTYHISMTQSVYLKLENNILRISHTNSKIPKRAMWNEPKHTVPFTYHRLYNLRSAEIILLPRGLTHKRIWSKKYPICVVLNKEFMHTDLPNNKKLYKDDSEIEEVKNDSEASDNTNKQEDDEKTEVDDFKDVFSEIDNVDDIPEDWDTLNLERNLQTNLYLFARTGRDKEDWFRRLVAATHFNDETKPTEIKDETNKEDQEDTSISSEVNDVSLKSDVMETSEAAAKNELKDEEEEYLDYMARLGQIKREAHIISREHTRHSRLFFRKRKNKHTLEDEVDAENKEKEVKDDKEKNDDLDEHVWFNFLFGRLLFDINKNTAIIANLQERIQRKLSTIKLPYFIEEIMISHINLGTESPRFHKIYAPTMDERGMWIDMDITYDGLIKLSLVTKLNLMKLKEKAGRTDENTRPTSPNSDDNRSPMFHSDIEDSAESSSDDEGYILSQPVASTDSLQDGSPRDAKSKKLLRMIDNIASSSLFQQATENKYIKRAMEGVSKTELKLTVEIRTLDGTLAVNISPPPSDRIWLGFRGNPKLVISAKPAFGERSITLTNVTRWIEKKLSQEFQKFLVFPNMEDFVCPIMTPRLPQ